MKTLLVGPVGLGWIVGALLVEVLPASNAAPPGAPPPALAPQQERRQSSSASKAIQDLKDEEIQVAQRLRQEFPKRTDSLALLGNAYNRQGNTGEAVKCWDACLKTNPRRVDAYDGLAQVALRKGEPERAVSLWQQALAVDPRSTEVAAHLGLALIDLGRLQEAKGVLLAAATASPRSSECHYLLGKLHLQLGEYAEAKRCYTRATEIDPRLTNAFYGLAQTCTRLAQHEQSRQAMETYRQLRAKDREDFQHVREAAYDLISAKQSTARTYTDAGRLYRGHGFLLKAEQCWRRAIALDSNSAACRAQLAMLLIDTQGDLEEANRLALEVVQLQPAAASYFLLSQICESKRDRPNALAAIQRAVQLDPDNQDYRRMHDRMQQEE